MSKQTPRSARSKGFTLIELLVVVAIIALLISILLPSLSKARAQARTTLCLTRIGQMTKAFLIYANDYDEAPPFVATGHNYGWMNDTPDPLETWLYDCYTGLNETERSAAVQNIAYSRQEDWQTQVPESGTLFTYTRFANLYRCPEFERISDPMKSHNVFNYTRAIWGRRYILPIETNWQEDWGSVEGPIMKPSQLVSPAALPMVLDEQWNRFVACQPDFPYGTDGGCWNCNDPIFAEHNNIAVSHGQPVRCHYHDLDDRPGLDPFLWKRGGAGCYDGHAELWRDPWPGFELGNNKRRGPWRIESWGSRQADELNAMKAFMSLLIHAQRGFDPKVRYGNLLVIQW